MTAATSKTLDTNGTTYSGPCTNGSNMDVLHVTIDKRELFLITSEKLQKRSANYQLSEFLQKLSS